MYVTTKVKVKTFIGVVFNVMIYGHPTTS